MLEVKSLDAFYGRAHILSGLSLEVARGEVIALLGRNGAGKSTALKCIAGLVSAARGEIRFLGERIDRLAPHAIAQRGIGYVPQERRIFSTLTVAENLEVGRRPPRAGAPAWTPEALCALFPNLAHMQDRSAGRISGGEQQMLAVARTLMGNPLCVLLDEPSEGLAPLIVEQVAATVRRLKAQGVAVLLAEQNLNFAVAVADRAYIIEAGRVRYAGDAAELTAGDEIRAAHLAL